MWPFEGRRLGKTVAERRIDNTAALVRVANDINRLQSRVVWIERNAPYERSDRKRKQLDIEKLRLEEQIKSLEKRHHQLASRNKG